VSDAAGNVMTSASWQVKGTHNATNPAFGGFYLPSLYVDFVESSVALGNTLTGSAKIASVSNVGSDAAPNPSIEVVVELTSADYLTSNDKSFSAKVFGKE